MSSEDSVSAPTASVLIKKEVQLELDDYGGTWDTTPPDLTSFNDGEEPQEPLTIEQSLQLLVSNSNDRDHQSSSPQFNEHDLDSISDHEEDTSNTRDSKVGSFPRLRKEKNEGNVSQTGEILGQSLPGSSKSASNAMPVMRLCLYCERLVNRRDTVSVPIETNLRMRWFRELCMEKEECADKMEQFYLRCPAKAFVCKDHLHPLLGRESLLFDPVAVQHWKLMVEWDKQGIRLTDDVAMRRCASMRCVYCHKYTNHWQSIISEKNVVPWLTALSMGDSGVEDYLRLDIKSRLKNSICCSHFLRSSFVSFVDVNGLKVTKLRFGEIPLPDAEVVKFLRERIDELGIHAQPSTSPDAAEKEMSLDKLVEEAQMKPPKEEFFEPKPILTWSRLPKGVCGAGLCKRPDQFIWWDISSAGLLVTHRFMEIDRGTNEYVCVSCKECVREIDSVYLANQKAWKREHLTSVPKPRPIRSPFASWISDNKEWLRSKFTYKVHEFSAKAKTIWDEEVPEETRKRYKDAWLIERQRIEEEKAVHMKQMDDLDNVRPALQGIPAATVIVIDKKAHADIGALKHVCMMANRPWTEDHINEEGQYKPPSLALKMYPGSEDFLRNLTRPRKRRSAVQTEEPAQEEEFVIYDEHEPEPVLPVSEAAAKTSKRGRPRKPKLLLTEDDLPPMKLGRG